MTIAFTGATGQFGAHVAEALLARTDASNLVALARDPQKATDLAEKDIEVRAFDYDQTDTLADALTGVDRLLLVSGNAIGQRVPQHKAVIDAAEAAGVSFLAYTSFLHTDTASIIAVAPEHQETEKLLADTSDNLDVALLRNGWYTENYTDTVTQAVSTGTLLSSAGNGRVSSATRADLAAAAATVLTAEEPAPGTYELGGDTSFTMADLVAAITEVSGTQVALNEVSGEQHAAILAEAGLPEGLVGFLVSTDAAIAAGELEDPNPGALSELIGRPTTPLADSLADWLK
ncbi:MAG: NAD(P)H-binding protein [Candidatus Corynebacterium faecigallinarum]|uniref:NAD(P)H-binding protein n=1 Tax=Candidatus Corynebacterium faecigallinarum TaxID=2838528 RepID=UPI003FB73AF2